MGWRGGLRRAARVDWPHRPLYGDDLGYGRAGRGGMVGAILSAVVRLRSARMDDAGRLLRLRNDRAVRQNSRHARMIGSARHDRWLRATLADPARRLYVVQCDRVDGSWVDIGMARLDRRRRGADLSLALAPVARGRGHARYVIAALLRRLGALGWGSRARAVVRAGNAPSVLAFTRAGFLVQGIERTSRGPWLVMERRR